VQQVYPAQWAMAGGDLKISAQADVRRVTQVDGQLVNDSSYQVPTNWLYRRGYIDPATGLFGIGGVDADIASVTDPAASTTWWVDYSNFFQGVGALGGGDVTILAGRDVINVDAVAPTNARMPGRLDGNNVAPDPTKLVELGGGDLVVRAGQNIDGGMYYVERGSGTLFAGGSITTNASRSPSLGLLSSSGLPASADALIQSRSPEVFDPLTWLPTTLFLGKGEFDVAARGDVLLGPTTNTFLLPQGLNNKFWYKTYFNTYAADAQVNVTSFGGSVTHRHSVTLPLETEPKPILLAWLEKVNLFQTSSAASRPSNWQPWIRLAETQVTPFETVLTLTPPTLRSTAFGGDINLAGPMTLFPSASGTLELAASGSIVGLQPSGRTLATSGQPVTAWMTASINVSDASPSATRGAASPLAYQSLVGRSQIESRQTSNGVLDSINVLFRETGSYTGAAGSIETKQALHAPGPLHDGDEQPLRIYGGGDISGFSLFSPKAAQILAGNDIADVAFYIQNVDSSDITVVSAGRDITPYSENTALRTRATDLRQGNIVVDPSRSTVLTSAAGTAVTTQVLPGDIQISGPGVLEVIAGRSLDLGTGANLTDGTGAGITSIGNFRNPALPFAGADIIALAGVTGAGGNGPALGLSNSSLDFESFLSTYPIELATTSSYLEQLGIDGSAESLSDEQQAIVALEMLFSELRNAGRNAATVGYDSGYAALETLFGTEERTGEIFTRARDIRTSTGGAVTLAAPGGGVTMASDIFGNPLTPPGIVTEYGGAVSIVTDGNVDIGQARIFTLRGGDVTMWSSSGNIAAGTAAKTVVTAPPTRVVIDTTSADVQTDLGGLATGGGIGVLASVEGVEAGNVDLIAPQGVVDAGDAGIRVTGNLNIAATAVLNSATISVGGASSGVPASAPVSAPSISGVSSAAASAGAAAASASSMAGPQKRDEEEEEEEPSLIVVEVIGYGGEG
jgi:hypothetical protein